ncbi:MAG TPA: TRAM domain-containing protein [Longimicrobiales bacterium]|nr:TRAM domain-containing protein [Longimicrobiales bacterium]
MKRKAQRAKPGAPAAGPELVAITGIAAGGAGVGRLQDGRAVFVHRTAPGDEAYVKVIDEKARFARATVLKIEKAGQGRRKAPCPHYARCGGCTLEHLEYMAQLRVKSFLVADALNRIGKLNVALPHVEPSPSEFRYRNRVSFTLMRLQHGRVVAGFHELEKPGRIVDIGGACLLPEEPIAEAWDELRANWGPDANLLPSGGKLRLTLRASANGAISLVVEGGNSAGDAERLLQVVPRLSSIWHRPRTEDEMVLLGGQEAIQESWQDEELDLSGSVFLQVNRAAASKLEDYVLERLGNVKGKNIIDAYCGVGLHARRLARAGAFVTGIELDNQAIKEAQAARVENASFICGRAEEELPRLLPADIVILNPPRAGVDVGAITPLLRRPVDKIIYISCNPATLARDLERLAPRYELHTLRCFDLFPQTAHVESVAELKCVTT